MTEFVISNAVLSTFMLDNLYKPVIFWFPRVCFVVVIVVKHVDEIQTHFEKKTCLKEKAYWVMTAFQTCSSANGRLWMWLSPLPSNRERHPGFRERHGTEICDQPSSGLQYQRLHPDVSYQHRDHHYHHWCCHGDRAEHSASTDAHTGTSLYPGCSERQCVF